MDKIDLDAIIKHMEDIREEFTLDNSFVKVCMKEAIHQALVLASEKATIQQINPHTREVQYEGLESYYFNNPNGPDEEITVYKQSILDIETLIV